jgi:hypothetical protein
VHNNKNPIAFIGEASFFLAEEKLAFFLRVEEKLAGQGIFAPGSRCFYFLNEF